MWSDPLSVCQSDDSKRKHKKKTTTTLRSLQFQSVFSAGNKALDLEIQKCLTGDLTDMKMRNDDWARWSANPVSKSANNRTRIGTQFRTACLTPNSGHALLFHFSTDSTQTEINPTTEEIAESYKVRVFNLKMMELFVSKKKKKRGGYLRWTFSRCRIFKI